MSDKRPKTMPNVAYSTNTVVIAIVDDKGHAMGCCRLPKLLFKQFVQASDDWRLVLHDMMEGFVFSRMFPEEFKKTGLKK